MRIYVAIMGHVHIPFDHIEERWTYRQLMAVCTIVEESISGAQKKASGKTSYSQHLANRGI